VQRAGASLSSEPLSANGQKRSEDGQITTELVKHGTRYRELVAFGSWLQAHQCPVVALESTGVYTPGLSRATMGQCAATSQSLRLGVHRKWAQSPAAPW
jgi:hypothetical protein